jgi:hypothetical protein
MRARVEAVIGGSMRPTGPSNRRTSNRLADANVLRRLEVLVE